MEELSDRGIVVFVQTSEKSSDKRSKIDTYRETDVFTQAEGVCRDFFSLRNFTHVTRCFREILLSRLFFRVKSTLVVKGS